MIQPGYSLDFLYCVNFVLDHEGTDIVVNPHHGDSRYGISEQYDGYTSHELCTMLLDGAIDFYYHLSPKKSWVQLECDRIPFPLSLVFWDCVIHSGHEPAISCLQTLVGADVTGDMDHDVMIRLSEFLNEGVVFKKGIAQTQIIRQIRPRIVEMSKRLLDMRVRHVMECADPAEASDFTQTMSVRRLIDVAYEIGE